MIGKLTGTLTEKQFPEILVDVTGVGYELQLPMSCFCQLPEAGKQISLFTHFVVREDAQLLYGFTNTAARTLFRELIKVNGIGPKVALAILSTMNTEQFVTAIGQDHISALVRCPGIGKKTAERLLIEMKDRLKQIKIGYRTTYNKEQYTEMKTQPTTVEALQQNIYPEDEAISALVNLGYKQNIATKVIYQLPKDNQTSEQLVRQALKSLG